ncbi:MAG: hypothetical protein K2J80_09185, partial [Oscillospiraceae bacterium]|nr:hypothetical protein [Oscillospiraceae bacterium]
TVTLYRNQLADFYPIGSAMFSLFSEGVFGDDTNNLYGKLISVSATYGSVSQIREKGGTLDGCSLTALLFNVPSYFEIR